MPTPTPLPSGGPATQCFNNTLYTTSYVQQFADADSWRVANGGNWYTGYPWGRANPGGNPASPLDASYYMDKSLGLGTPVYDPFSITNGDLLTIEAQPVSAVPGLSPSQLVYRGYDYQYTSGMISTSGQNSAGQPQTTFHQRFGYYEVKAQLPKGQGIWPSFWMLDYLGLSAEVDVFEFLGQNTSQIYQSIHYQNGSGHSIPTPLNFDPTTGLHTYGVLITPTTDNYYIDGVQTQSYPDASIHDFYFMVSLQIGGPSSGTFPGQPDNTTPWPAILYLQYFHAYAPTTSTCSAARLGAARPR